MEEGTLYFRDGTLLYESGSVRAFRMNDEIFMEQGVGHTLVAAERDIADYIWQISDKPFGNCLAVGLGLGVAANYILSVPKVRSLTVIEEDKDIIEVQNKIRPIKDNRLRILNGEILPYFYKTRDRYDYIWLNCYNCVDEDTIPLIADLAAGAKKCLTTNGIVRGWLDSNTPEVFVEYFFKLFED